MKKEKLKEKVEEILEMDANDLSEFEQTLSMSDVEQKPRAFLQKAIDLRRDALNAKGMAVIAHGDLAMSEAMAYSG